MGESLYAIPQVKPLSDQRRDRPPSPDAAGNAAESEPPFAYRPAESGPDPLSRSHDRGLAGLSPLASSVPSHPADATGAAADDDDDTIRVRKALPQSAPMAKPEPISAAERFVSWSATHVGTVRKHNEDSLIDRSDLGLWAVADGAGGHSRGDVASRMVAEALESMPPNLSAAEVLAEVRQRMTEVNAALRASVTPPEISATTVAVLIARGDHFACLWAGDSRIYLLRDGTMTQVTRDHSLVQDMVEAGAIRAEDAETHPSANIITRAVGSGDELDLDKVTDRLLAGDRFLICSDGLCKTIPDSLTAQLLASPRDPADRLIQAALEHHGRDNVTAVVVDVLS